MPSKERPPNTDLQRAPLLEAQVEIEIAAGDLDRARSAADELELVAGRFENKPLAAGCRPRPRHGCSSPTAMRPARSSPCPTRCGSGTRSAPRTRRRTRAWAWPTPMPPAAASTGPPWSGGRPARSSTGSKPLRHRRAPVPRIAPAAAADVFRREGDYWSVVFDGQTVRVRDLKGMRYLARLLAEPGREFHVLDLVAAETGRGGAGRHRRGRPAGHARRATRASFSTPQAKEAYRRRLAEIDEDIAEARAIGDVQRAAQADAERDFLVQELARAFGLGGRGRRAASSSERARAGVTRAIRQAIARIGEHHPRLGEHLGRTIRTGTYCAYAPDPRAAAGWNRLP